MNWGLAWLELSEDADERAIKRAYAKHLRTTRPDEDPAAFQLLHEAYQAALAACHAAPVPASSAERNRRVQEDGGEALHVPTPPDAGEAAWNLLQEGAEVPRGRYPDWLATQARDWSLTTRGRVALHVLRAMRDARVALHRDNAAHLYPFLGFDDVYSEVDPYEWRALVARAHDTWLRRPSRQDVLGTGVSGVSGEAACSPVLQAWLPALRTPRSHLRNLLDAMRPGAARGVPELLTALGYRPDAPLSEGIDPVQARFWTRQGIASDAVALQVGLLQTLPFCLLLFALTVWIAGKGWLLWAGSTPLPMLDTVIVFMVALLLPAALVINDHVDARLREWQRADEELPSPHPRLRACGIPLLVGAVAVICGVLSLSNLVFIPKVLGVMLSWKVLRLAQLRHRDRQRASPAPSLPNLLVMVPAALMLWPAWILALIYWARDLHLHRAQVQWR